jgi:hypothetical protein
MRSYTRLLLVVLLTDKNEVVQLIINISIEMAVNSSIIVSFLRCSAFKVEKTTKQSPNRLAEVFKICGDLLLAFIFGDFRPYITKYFGRYY